MTVRVAINGFGRIGRNILRQLHLFIAFQEKAVYMTPARAE